MTYVRLPRDQQTADERSGRFPSPGCRVLRDADLHVLAGGPVASNGPRRSTPPSPEKAAAYRSSALAGSGAVDVAYAWSLWDMAVWMLPWVGVGLAIGGVIVACVV